MWALFHNFRAGCWKSLFSHPPNPGAPRRTAHQASFSHREDPQRTSEGTPRDFTRCGLAGRPFWASCRNILPLCHTGSHRSSRVPKSFFRSLLALDGAFTLAIL